MLNEFPIEMLDLRDSPIKEDIIDIEDKMEMFYLTLNFEEDIDLKTQCLDAKNYMDSCRILVRNLLDKDENEYIGQFPKKFGWMLDNLGRADKRLEDIETETIEKLETVELLNEKKFPESPKLRKYLNNLLKYMEHLVYYPLIKTYDYCRKRKIKDKEIFLYYVFVELYNSSESLGSISAEKFKTTPKQPSISITKSSHEEDLEQDFNKPEEQFKEEEEDEIQEEDEDSKENEIFEKHI